MRILIVEDDLELSNVTARFLKKRGFDVFQAESGGAAFDIWMEEQGMFALVLINVFLADENGIDLADKFRARNRGVKILLTAEHIEETRILERIAVGGYDFLLKPYNMSKLFKIIKKNK